eukprot:TRINITY_DN1535_c0_g2_i1.p1 TRINITY_DN1535_c0_g2~~TRINITY_DN1535_c0_g2_i1.p1  ORF type:complete len:325 (+),score=95.49 TRINITY_DN1535_c0_g2_i1:262-1236(+)
MCEVKTTFRRLNMEVEFQKHARRVKKDGVWHEISHEYWMVSDSDVRYADNDIIEVWLDDHKVIAQGGNTTFPKDEGGPGDMATPQTPLSTDPGDSGLVVADAASSESPERPPSEDEGAAEASRGRGKYVRKFVIEQIYVARQRKCIEGFFWDDTPKKGIHILNEGRSAVIYARQTVRKLQHPRVHEIVGAMKKQREKVDKLLREEASEKARIEALEAARKKKAKDIDFTKPSVWGERRERRKKRERQRDKKCGRSGDNSDEADPPPLAATTGWAAAASGALRSIIAPLQFCCGPRPRQTPATPSDSEPHVAAAPSVAQAACGTD